MQIYLVIPLFSGMVGLIFGFKIKTIRGVMADIKVIEQVLKDFERENEEDPIEDAEYMKGVRYIVDEMRQLEDNYFAKGIIDFIREYDRRRKKTLGSKA
jgi:hypothetical protein